MHQARRYSSRDPRGGVVDETYGMTEPCDRERARTYVME
jgi:hypothetical protein